MFQTYFKGGGKILQKYFTRGEFSGAFVRCLVFPEHPNTPKIIFCVFSVFWIFSEKSKNYEKHIWLYQM